MQGGTLLRVTHVPTSDEVPESPVDWDSIPLGAGQEPNAYGGANSFQHTLQGNEITRTSVRRNPDETFRFIVRVPERP